MNANFDFKNNSIIQFFDWEYVVLDKKKSTSLKTELIIKKINRKEIGLDNLKQSLKEVIAFKLIKIEELLHNYIDYYIKDKQLYAVLDFIDLVNKYHFKY